MVLKQQQTQIQRNVPISYVETVTKSDKNTCTQLHDLLVHVNRAKNWGLVDIQADQAFRIGTLFIDCLVYFTGV